MERCSWVEETVQRPYGRECLAWSTVNIEVNMSGTYEQLILELKGLKVLEGKIV